MHRALCKIAVSCAICNTQFKTDPSRLKKAKHGMACSKECLKKLQSKLLTLSNKDVVSSLEKRRDSETGRFTSEGASFRINYTCKQCSKLFIAGRSNKRQYCSGECYRAFRAANPRKCTELGCTRGHFAYGLCRLHYDRNWRATHPEKVKATSEKDRDVKSDRNYRKKFGIKGIKEGGPRGLAGIAEYNRRLLEQGGGCAICGKPPYKHMRLACDHNHKTGLQRGLLCAPCNGRILGRLERYSRYGVTLNKLRAYLEKYDSENPLLK